MASLNRVMVIGNLGTDPEMRFTPSGNPVTSFRIATSWNSTTPEGERRQETEWFTVVAWSKLAEQCNQFLSKGRRAYVEGRLRTRSWEGQDGQRRYRTEIVANRVIFLDRPGVAPLPEEAEELAEFMDWSRCLLIGMQSVNAATKIVEFYRESQKRRSENIGKRLDETLKEGEIGVLLMREGHQIQYPEDVKVFYVAPPSLDEIHRWMRAQAGKEQAGDTDGQDTG